MEFRLSLVVLVFIISTGYCQVEDMEDSAKKSLKKYCGNHLVQTLQTICQGNYNTIYKQDSFTNYDDYVSDRPAAESDLGFPFKKRSEATAMLGTYRTRRKRYAQGVYNECCQKSCTQEELSSYCAVPYKRKR